MLSCQWNGDVLAITGSMQVQFLDALAQELRACVDEPQELVLDLAAVTTTDLAGLQLLLAFLRSRPAQAATRLGGLRPPLRNALEMTGLYQQMAAYLA